MGDSHAGALQVLLNGVHDKLGVGIHLVETPRVVFPMNSGGRFPPRQILFKKIMERIRPGDVVLLARLYLDRTNGNARLRVCQEITVPVRGHRPVTVAARKAVPACDIGGAVDTVIF